MTILSPYAASVVILLTLGTAALVFYVRIVLPRQVIERFQNSMAGLGTAVELRFPSHHGLTVRVVRLSAALGEAVGLSPRQRRDLETAAQLRDIGLCAVPYRLLNANAPSEWTEADHATYWRHPEVSAAMLEMIPSLCHVAGIVRAHHAPFEGAESGLSTRGEEIPIEARILCIITEYVWLERSMGHLLAVDKLRELSGTRFDPRLVQDFIEVLTSPHGVEPVSSAVTVAQPR